MAFLGNAGTPSAPAPAGPSFESILAEMTASGWQMVSEGSSGAQLKKGKEMSTADKVCIGIGVPLLLMWGVGLLLILIGVLDYAFFTKEQTHFLSRTAPERFTVKKKTGFRII